MFRFSKISSKSRTIATRAILLIAGPAFAQSSAKLPDFAPERWGLTSSVTRLPQAPGSHQIILRNPQNGRVVTQVFTPLGRLESESETTAAGRLLWRREIGSGSISRPTVEERFAPRHSRTTLWEAPPTREIPGSHFWVETTHWENEIPRTTRNLLAREKALSACAATTMPMSQAESLIGDLRWLQFEVPSDSRSNVTLPNNVILEGCDRFPGGGNAAVAKALEAGLQQGLRCLKAMGPARSSDIARLLSYLDPKLSAPVRIQCGVPGKLAARGARKPDGTFNPIPISSDLNARALSAGDEDFPGVLLNVSSGEFLTEPGKLKGTLFHEMLHFLGYLHSESLDVPYLTDACCFAEGKGASPQACDLLKNDTDYRSADYQTQFAEIMTGLGRPSVAEYTTWNTAAKADPDKVNPLYAVSRKLAELNPKSQFRYQILAYTGIELSPQGERERLASELASPLPDWQRQGSQAVGKSLAALLRKEASAFESAWPQTRELRTRLCAQGGMDELAQLAQPLKAGLFELYSQFDRELFNKYAHELHEPCAPQISSPNRR